MDADKEENPDYDFSACDSCFKEAKIENDMIAFKVDEAAIK